MLCSLRLISHSLRRLYYKSNGNGFLTFLVGNIAFVSLNLIIESIPLEDGVPGLLIDQVSCLD